MAYDPVLFATLDGMDLSDYVIGTYFIESGSEDLLKQAAAIAVEQTTGTWVAVPAETTEVRDKHVGRVLGVYEIPDYEMERPTEAVRRRYVAQIAFPEVNFGSCLPMLLSTVIGNISMAGRLKLLDLAFPERFLRGFQGPKFGIEGVRKYLNVSERPLLNNMIKPCTGIPPEVSAKLFYEAALGGADFIKDDELIADAPFSSVVERVRQCMAMEKRVYEETGERTLYAVNITDRVDRIRQHAINCIEAGANGLMLNYLTVGIDSLRMLAEDPAINVPILAHLDFAGVMYESQDSGISSHLVLGKLPRIAGCDIIVYPCPYAKFLFLREKHIRIANVLRTPLRHLKRVFPMPGGGVHPGNLPLLFDDLGTDWVVGAGGAIHGHPMGATAGARALRQAIDALMQGRPLPEAAREHRELAVALECWGMQGEKRLFEMK